MKKNKATLSRENLEYLRAARVARLATVDKNHSVHLVPIVFADSGSRVYFVLDRKRKQSGVELKRVRNITETGNAELLIDYYSEKWGELSFLLLHCSAKVLGPGTNLNEKRLAARILKKKYQQYASGGYFPENLEEAVFVRLEPQRAVFWQNLRRSLV